MAAFSFLIKKIFKSSLYKKKKKRHDCAIGSSHFFFLVKSTALHLALMVWTFIPNRLEESECSLRDVIIGVDIIYVMLSQGCFSIFKHVICSALDWTEQFQVKRVERRHWYFSHRVILLSTLAASCPTRFPLIFLQMYFLTAGGLQQIGFNPNLKNFGRRLCTEVRVTPLLKLCITLICC